MLQKRDVYLLIIATSIIVLLITFSLVFFYFFFKKKNQIIQEKELIKKAFRETLLQSQIEIREQTLQYICAQLHDNLAQIASLIKINLNTLNLSNTEKATEKVAITLDLTRQLIKDIKSLSISVGSDWLEQNGLIKAIETEVDRINKTDQFTASFQAEGLLPDINKDKAIILYRMSQEVINNMVKHSMAKQMDVLLNINENSFTLVFMDKGVGFNIAEKTDCVGAGMRSLQERARLINVQLTIKSSPGNGTYISIALPL